MCFALHYSLGMQHSVSLCCPLMFFESWCYPWCSFVTWCCPWCYGSMVLSMMFFSTILFSMMFWNCLVTLDVLLNHGVVLHVLLNHGVCPWCSWSVVLSMMSFKTWCFVWNLQPLSTAKWFVYPSIPPWIVLLLTCSLNFASFFVLIIMPSTVSSNSLISVSLYHFIK